MGLQEEMKKRKETMDSLEGKEKVKYIWMYYKWHIIIIVGVILAGTNLVYHWVSDPDVVLNGIVLNAYGVDSEPLVKEFIAEYEKDQEMDTKEEIVTLDMSFQYEPNDASGTKNYETIHALGAWVGAESIDFIVADTASMEELADATYYMSLAEVLTVKQMAAYSSKIISVNGVPTLLDVSGSEKLSKIYLDQYEEMALAVTKGAPNISEVRDFVDYLMAE